MVNPFKIYKTAIPAESLTRQFFPVDYADAYACNIVAQKELTADELQIALWTAMPRWITALFKLRNRLVHPFGLKTEQMEDKNERLKTMILSGEGSVGVMSMAAKSVSETVLLLSDKHLDAFASLQVVADGELQIITSITLVRFHNCFGKMYFFFIKPFHKIVVKSGLKQTLRRMTKPKNAAVSSS